MYNIRKHITDFLIAWFYGLYLVANGTMYLVDNRVRHLRHLRHLTHYIAVLLIYKPCKYQTT